MKVVVLLSGGMDSGTLLAKAKLEGHTVVALWVNYGQRAAEQELESAKRICQLYAIPLVTVNMSEYKLLTKFTSLTAPHTLEIETETHTVIPGRNMFLLSLAVTLAGRLGFDVVWYGAQAIDTTYRDCHEYFVRRMRQASFYAYDIEIDAPLVNMSKREIVRLADELHFPIEETFSCYHPLEDGSPCGTCPSCRKRENALRSL